MTKTLVRGVKAVRRHERQRQRLSPKANALVGLGIGSIISAIVVVNDHSDPEVKTDEPIEDAKLVLRIVGLALACSQRGWKGAVTAGVGTAVISELYEPYWSRSSRVQRDSAEVFIEQAFIGVIGWTVVRLVARVV